LNNILTKDLIRFGAHTAQNSLQEKSYLETNI